LNFMPIYSNVEDLVFWVRIIYFTAK
jgi:hypothetical protein